MKNALSIGLFLCFFTFCIQGNLLYAGEDGEILALTDSANPAQEDIGRIGERFIREVDILIPTLLREFGPPSRCAQFLTGSAPQCVQLLGGLAASLYLHKRVTSLVINNLVTTLLSMHDTLFDCHHSEGGLQAPTMCGTWGRAATVTAVSLPLIFYIQLKQIIIENYGTQLLHDATRKGIWLYMDGLQKSQYTQREANLKIIRELTDQLTQRDEELRALDTKLRQRIFAKASLVGQLPLMRALLRTDIEEEAEVAKHLPNIDERCAVCWSEFDGKAASALPLVKGSCGHVFHNRCIHSWHAVSRVCPTCRNPQPQSDLSDLILQWPAIPTPPTPPIAAPAEENVVVVAEPAGDHEN